MTLQDTARSATARLLAGPALWPAQAHTPTVLGRQLVINRGEGSYVFTSDGRRLFDGTAGLWHANIGHSHPELAEAAYEQMKQLETYHIFARFTNDKALALGVRARYMMDPLRQEAVKATNRTTAPAKAWAVPARLYCEYLEAP